MATGMLFDLQIRDVHDIELEIVDEFNARLERVMDAVVVPAAKERAPRSEGGGTLKGQVKGRAAGTRDRRGRKLAEIKAKAGYYAHMADTIVFIPYKTRLGGGFHCSFPGWFHENGTVKLTRTPFMAPAILNNVARILEGLRG